MSINYQNVNLVMSAGFPEQFPEDHLPQIAFSGRSNVGKSSLINALLGRKSLARVSGSPGKTITANFYNIDRQYYLVDLPGYGFAKRPDSEREKWSTLMGAYFDNNPNLRLVVQLIDLKVGPTKDDDQMLSWLYETRTPYIIAATKADKLNVTDRRKNLDRLSKDQMILDGTHVIAFSALKGDGRDEILSIIERKALE
ncbi:MAG: YihA family ribosome biogenesis GTP-binding protein [Ruminococcaceae bacterium]|nr:YihA family ribosome biogenesis GTP-binding protein [Oscillospiraceae bacterium]